MSKIIFRKNTKRIDRLVVANLVRISCDVITCDYINCPCSISCSVVIHKSEWNKIKENTDKWISMNLQSNDSDYQHLAHDLLHELIEII